MNGFNHPCKNTCSGYNQDCADTIKALEQKLSKVVEALKKTVKENTIMIDDYECRTAGHDWEPDTSMTIMRCDSCGMGANTYEAKQALKEMGEL